MDWENFRTFAVAARHETMTQAARKLRVSIATVARRLDALEAELGLKLLHRTSHGLLLTPAGQALREKAGEGEQAMSGIERLAAGLRAGAWRTSVRVSATEPVISEILAPRLAALFSRSPDIRLDLVVESAVVSLALRDADIAVRMVQPQGDSLMMKRLPSLAMSLYGSTLYLAGRTAIADLEAERFIAYDETYGRIPERRWIEEQGLDGQVILRTSSTRATLNAVRAGVALAILPDVLSRPHRDLVPIKVMVPVPARDFWLAWHRDLGRSQPLRQVRAWVAESFTKANRGATG
jgi:DNA-binding transcriptional LysR family regulator